MSHFAEATTVDEACQKAVELVSEKFKAERVLVFYDYDADDLLVPRASHGIDKLTVYTTGEISLGLLQDALAGGEPQLLVDAMQDPKFTQRTSGVLSGIRSVICCPFKDSEGNPVGLVYADHRIQKAAFKKDDLPWMEGLAQDLGGTILKLS